MTPKHQQKQNNIKTLILILISFAVAILQSSCFLSKDRVKLSIVIDTMKIQVLDQDYKILSFSFINKCTNQIEIDINPKDKSLLDSQVNYKTDTIKYKINKSFNDSCGIYEIALYVTDSSNSIYSFYENIHITQMGYVIELEAERK